MTAADFVRRRGGENAGRPTDRYDVIVVGAGLAGCVLAARLSEDPSCEVLLVEAGPAYPTRQHLPLDIAAGDRLPSDRNLSHDWRFATTTSSRFGGRSIPLPRGRIVGGSSAVNGTFALRGFAADYDAWAAAGNDGWASADVLERFCRLETDLDFGERPWHGDDGPVPIRRYPAEEQSVIAQAFLAAAEEAGHPTVTDHNEPGAVGVGPLPVNTLDRLRIERGADPPRAGAGSAEPDRACRHTRGPGRGGRRTCPRRTARRRRPRRERTRGADRRRLREPSHPAAVRHWTGR